MKSMRLLEAAKKVVHPDFVIGEKDDMTLSENTQMKINSLVNKLKNSDMSNYVLPWVEDEVDRFLATADPEFEISANILIELLEKLVYAKGKEVTVEDKIIIGYLSIYCAI